MTCRSILKWAGTASPRFLGWLDVWAKKCTAWAFLILPVVLLSHANAFELEEAATVNLPSRFDLKVHQLPANQDNLLLWIPSKYGIRPGNTRFADKIQREGIDFWLVDLHTFYQASTRRYSYARFKPQHVKELIQHAVQLGWQNIILWGESRGAALAMRAAREWQLEHPANPALKGFVFFHPDLVDDHVPIGEMATFLPIARETNLPIYLFQPQHSIKSLHSRSLLENLESGGSDVYFHPLKGVRGGYHVRDLERAYDREIEENERIGERIRKAVDLLVRLQPPQQAAAPARHARHARHARLKEAPSKSHRGELIAIDRKAPHALRLQDDSGRLIDLRDFAGEVVWVNFWATWCGPCINEIASLMRLTERFNGHPFRVLTVNIDETAEHVAAFFDQLGYEPNFEVLFDPGGDVAKAWRVNAVPSTYRSIGNGCSAMPTVGRSSGTNPVSSRSCRNCSSSAQGSVSEAAPGTPTFQAN